MSGGSDNSTDTSFPVTTPSHFDDIVHVVQVSVAPVFLLSGIGARAAGADVYSDPALSHRRFRKLPPGSRHGYIAASP